MLERPDELERIGYDIGGFSVIRLVFELHAHKLAMMKGSDSCYFRKHVSTKHLEIRSGLTVKFI